MSHQMSDSIKESISKVLCEHISRVPSIMVFSLTIKKVITMSYQGTLKDRYEIYVTNEKKFNPKGYIKTFEQWLTS